MTKFLKGGRFQPPAALLVFPHPRVAGVPLAALLAVAWSAMGHQYLLNREEQQVALNPAEEHASRTDHDHEAKIDPDGVVVHRQKRKDVYVGAQLYDNSTVLPDQFAQQVNSQDDGEDGDHDDEYHEQEDGGPHFGLSELVSSSGASSIPPGCSNPSTTWADLGGLKQEVYKGANLWVGSVYVHCGTIKYKSHSCPHGTGQQLLGSGLTITLGTCRSLCRVNANCRYLVYGRSIAALAHGFCWGYTGGCAWRSGRNGDHKQLAAMCVHLNAWMNPKRYTTEADCAFWRTTTRTPTTQPPPTTPAPTTLPPTTRTITTTFTTTSTTTKSPTTKKPAKTTTRTSTSTATSTSTTSTSTRTRTSTSTVTSTRTETSTSTTSSTTSSSTTTTTVQSTGIIGSGTSSSMDDDETRSLGADAEEKTTSRASAGATAAKLLGVLAPAILFGLLFYRARERFLRDQWRARNRGGGGPHTEEEDQRPDDWDETDESDTALEGADSSTLAGLGADCSTSTTGFFAAQADSTDSMIATGEGNDSKNDSEATKLRKEGKTRVKKAGADGPLLLSASALADGSNLVGGSSALTRGPLGAGGNLGALGGGSSALTGSSVPAPGATSPRTAGMKAATEGVFS
ncbi:unnamed protein product, partial [Amoebophrya sp. A25]|eukprot:GSA25T00012797001.1